MSHGQITVRIGFYMNVFKHIPGYNTSPNFITMFVYIWYINHHFLNILFKGHVRVQKSELFSVQTTVKQSHHLLPSFSVLGQTHLINFHSDTLQKTPYPTYFNIQISQIKNYTFFIFKYFIYFLH